MKRPDIHEPLDFFEYLRVEDSVPRPDRRRLDVALLDMNHDWPNIGHDALAHVVLEAAQEFERELLAAGLKIRLLSFDVRRRNMLPEPPNGRFRVYIGTGGPGHLDPRMNDGVSEFSQGIRETADWEAPLFRLFDAIHGNEEASLIAVCHSFGLLCRWSGVARPVLRPEKSSGMPYNVLTDEALRHPWFSRFSEKLRERRAFRVIDNRLFDLVLERPGEASPLATETSDSSVVTMLELSRDPAGTMPRILGVNHHPEIIDREHIMAVLEEKRAHGDVNERWYRERAGTMRELLNAQNERESRLTSSFTLIEPLRFQLGKLVQERVADGFALPISV